MKKYIVCKCYECEFLTPNVIEQFDDLDLATQYRDLMKQAHPNSMYAVYERI